MRVPTNLQVYESDGGPFFAEKNDVEIMGYRCLSTDEVLAYILAKLEPGKMAERFER